MRVIFVFMFLTVVLTATSSLHGGVAPVSADLTGTIADPQGAVVPNAKVILQRSDHFSRRSTVTDLQGRYQFTDLDSGAYTLTAEADGFKTVTAAVNIVADNINFADLRFTQLTLRKQQVVVVASEPAALTPDPSERFLVRDEVLEANPGRPGTPISIPGLPIETASGGIKAPQYFAPGVAGDHGEPIAQFFQIGDYLYPNNLPANAHGNGYADPNPLISHEIGAVLVDGGAFNVREGNHAVNLAATYVPRDRLDPFLQLTADPRDLDLTAGWGRNNRGVHEWIAVEAASGNGFLHRLEHRTQFKVNGYRSFSPGHHELNLFVVGYYGSSAIPGLIPRDVPVSGDTIDPRQSDRTSTSIFIASDTWRPNTHQQVQFSVFFRTYDLRLRSNFGDGLIQQSEFRTVVGGNTTYIFKLLPGTFLLAGLDLRRDAPRGLDLKRAAANGFFQPITSNDITLGFATPYLSLDGTLTRNFHYNLGLRQEGVFFDNLDKISADNSFSRQSGLTLPKGTFTVLPPGSRFLPAVSLSLGEAFHTNDPRIGQGLPGGTSVATSHAAQLLLQKDIHKTALRITLARVANSQELAKIDPDTGLQQDVGASIVRSITVSARRYFSVGYLQGSFSRATAQDRLTRADIPEAPRLIWDFSGGTGRLPLNLRARGELEYVGPKPLGDGFTATPVRELRLSLARSFSKQQFETAINFLRASGYTGQTLETLQLSGETAPLERVVGVPLKSYVALSLSYRSRHE